MNFSKKYKTTHTSWLRSLQAMEPGITGMIQKQMLSQHEYSAHHTHSLRLKYHSAVITQVCHGLYGWSTAKWQMETGLLWQLTCSYNLVCQQFMARKRKWHHSLHHHSYLDLNSCDLFLFPKMKLKFKEIIQKYLQVVLNGITKDKIQTWCFWQWQNQWPWYTNSWGEYPEGNMM